MKRMFLTLIVVLGLMTGTAFAQMGGGMMGGQTMMGTDQQQAQPMPYQTYPGMGYGYGMGPGMMMGPGMGYGMMGPGYGMGPGMMGYGGPGMGMMGGMGRGMMMGPGMMGMMHNMMMGRGMMGGYGMGPMMGGPGMMGMGPMMMGPGMGYGMMGYGYSKAYQKFLDETKDLRKQLNEKRFDYFEALRDPKTKPETISKLRRELYELKKKIYEKSPLKNFGYFGCY